MEGYFLHLIVDYLFYNKYFTNFDTRLYNDYDIINKKLIEKYKITIPDEIKADVKFKEGTIEILDIDKLEKMISEISKKKISEYKKEAKQNGIVTTNREDNKLITSNGSKKEKIALSKLQQDISKINQIISNISHIEANNINLIYMFLFFINCKIFLC